MPVTPYSCGTNILAARTCLRQVGLTDRHKDARQVLKWLRANDMRQVSREDIRRNALGRRLDAGDSKGH
jgi:hypothetical protein